MDREGLKLVFRAENVGADKWNAQRLSDMYLPTSGSW